MVYTSFYVILFDERVNKYIVGNRKKTEIFGRNDDLDMEQGYI
jgi:hypothetical protein